MLLLETIFRMNSVFRIAAAALVLSTGRALPAVRITFVNGSEMQAISAVREQENIVLQIGSGTITVPAREVQQCDTVADPNPESAVATVAHPPKNTLQPRLLLAEASNSQALPLEFIESVAKVESGLRVEAVSNKGAIGLMQLMPKTAAGLGVDAAAPAENALGGAKYLRQLLLRYNGDTRLALAAYNAGPQAVDRYRGVPPYEETIQYVNRVLREYENAKREHSHSGSLKPTAAVRPQPTERARLN
jgi:transglycosylase-like protein with SLT domain